MIERLLEAERAVAVGLLDQAERIYQQAIDADPRNSIAVVGLARVALERGDEARAYAMGLRALEIDGDNQAARRLVDRLVEVRAARGEAPPEVTKAPTRGATAVAVAPPPTAPAPAPAAPKTKATESPAAIAKPATPAAPLQSRTRDVLVEMPQPTAPAKPIAAAPERPATPPPAKPIAVAPGPPVTSATAKPIAAPEKPGAVAPGKQVTPARDKPVSAGSSATVRPAEPKTSTPSAAPKGAPEAPASAARAAASAAPRKSKVTQPVKIRTAGSRRSAPTVTPPKTTLPKAKPLMPPSEAAKPVDDHSAEAPREAPREAPARAARAATRGASPAPVRKMRNVAPKQPGLFDRLFRPRR